MKKECYICSMNELMDNLVSYGDILLSCSIKHDMHMEHRMPAHSIIFVRSGKLIIEGRDSTDEITADNFVFVRRDCSVNVTKVPLDGTPYRGINFTLPRRYLKEYYNRIAAICRKMRGISPIGQTVNILPQTTGLKSLFGSFMPYTDSGETPSDEWLRLKVDEAIMCLLNIDQRFYPTLFDFNEVWKIDLLDFMEHNFTEDLTLEEFAAYTGRSLATFKRDFARISTLPPQRWITEHRLERAKELMIKYGLTAQDAGYTAGFKNRSHFSQAFKKMYGHAPSEYIKMKVKNEEQALRAMKN